MEIQQINYKTSISFSFAFFSCCLLTFLFVSSVYWIPTKGKSRNHTRVIKSRIVSVAIASILAVLYTWIQLSNVSFLHFIQFWFGRLTWNPLFHLFILFIGPMLNECLQCYTHASYRANWKLDLNWINARNYIFGPLFEEIVFRGCMIPFYESASLSKMHIILYVPCFFGIAHLHHGYLLFNSLGSDLNAFKVSFLSTLLQFLYTTAFGMYSTFVYIHTRSLLCIILCHSFCNWMGLPELDFLKESNWNKKYGLLLMHVLGAGLFIIFLNDASAS